MDAALFGLIAADVIAEPVDLRNPPAPGGLYQINSITLTTGGNVCNTGVAMAKLGMKVAAAGLVGDDVLGRAVTAILSTSGMDTHAVFTVPGGQTCASMVAIEPGGERCFYHTPGVTRQLDADAFRKCFSIFRQCSWVQIGYFGLLPTLTPQLPTVLTELRLAAPQTRIALDTVNPTADWKLLQPILPLLDLFAPSRTEAAALTGKSDPREMVAIFRRHMKTGLIGIKLDAQGCYLDDGQSTATVPVYPIKVVDTTGAGDTWFAGLLTALQHKMPLEKAGQFANRVAADCCLAIGASAGIKTFEETLLRL